MRKQHLCKSPPLHEELRQRPLQIIISQTLSAMLFFGNLELKNCWHGYREGTHNLRSWFNLSQVQMTTQLEMGPDLTSAYFWPAVNKRLTHLWPRYFLSHPRRFFLTRSEKNEKFGIFKGNFPKPNPNQRKLTRPITKLSQGDPLL